MPEGRLRRALRRMTADDNELAAEELQRDARASGATPLSACGIRERVTVRGEIRGVTLRPRAGVPAVEAELYDGTGALLLVWLGRRRIEGVSPGANLVVEGRVGLQLGQKTMFNPAYRLLPRSE